jgi:GDP-L-fucose synthase
VEKGDKIFVAGHRGMVGSAIVRKFKKEGYTNLVLRTSKELDLRNQEAVKQFYAEEKPKYVILAAAKVGGILANDTYRAEFLFDNLAIAQNVIDQAYKNDVEKLLFLGSSCIYPKMAPQPLKEESLLTGLLEETNEPYAIAKIAGIKLCEAYRDQYGCNFISAMPTNLYGTNDNFDLKSSHVLPALLRKFHEAKVAGNKEVEVWGSGNPMREFLHVDDLAEACYFLMKNYNQKPFVNVGTGVDIRIGDLAKMIAQEVGFQGVLKFDSSKPDGTPRKLMDVSRINDLGWRHKIELNDGIKQVYNWVLEEGILD